MADLATALELNLALDDELLSAAPWRAKVAPLVAEARDRQRAALDVPLRDLVT